MPKRYKLERHDDSDDGIITYEIWDYNAPTYRRLCSLSEVFDSANRAQAKIDAELIVKALNGPTPDELFEALKHGDVMHRVWLREAIQAVFEGKPVPPPYNNKGPQNAR